MSIRVTVWHEYRHEKKNPKVREVYPEGIHTAIAGFLGKVQGFQVRTATQDDEPDHGLSQEVVDATDVLMWWGHVAHTEVRDEIAERVQKRVLAGMGLIVLHSGHFSKPFQRLMGTTCNLKWREHPDEREILWVTRPGHPIVEGISDHFILEHEEMYGEFFDIPEPEQTVLISSFTGGEVFRSGCCWNRGAGKVFYFRPGHETFPTYYDQNVQRILINAVRWASPCVETAPHAFGRREMGWVDEPVKRPDTRHAAT